MHYIGEETDGEFMKFRVSNTIHVFDWYGRLVQKLETDYDIDKMFLDTVRNRLYVTRPKSDDVYYLDLDEVFD